MKREGAASIEFAFVLPLLMLVLFGIVELGRALHDYHVLDAAVRDAARYLARQPVDCSGATLGGCTLCNAQNGTCAGAGCIFTEPGDVLDAVALAMTGTISGGESTLAYWPHPPVSASEEVDIGICTLDGEAIALSGLYDEVGMVPHVRLTANVEFPFLFGQLIAPDATVGLTVAHNVVVTGN